MNHSTHGTIWDRSATIGLARERCTHCQGIGLRAARKESLAPCHCVLRAVFRACYNRFRTCVSREKSFGRIRLEQFAKGQDRRVGWGMKDEEYMADFLLVSRRALNDAEHQLFRFHFLLGADWRLCCRRLNIDRGLFFHSVYRIQQKLGRVYRELEPYALFPLDEYFAGAVEGVKPCNLRQMPDQARQRLDPPLRKAA